MTTKPLPPDVKRQAAHDLAMEFVKQTVARSAKPTEYAAAYAGAYRDIMNEFEREQEPVKKSRLADDKFLMRN